ncbi:MAG: HAMP domain-containing histidine kinase [Candidatus Izimaplasma sp.]|nr:HAMP domain-containing histidine kinase [Candidatus Izimaplasma bacterium]
MKPFKKLLSAVVEFYKSLSISTQLIITLILIFSSFFALQTVLNNTFFNRFYTEREFEEVHQGLINYVDDMNNPNTNLYDGMYDFTTSNNAYSVITDGEYRILNSTYRNYTITVNDTNNNDYTILVPNNDYTYQLDEYLSLTIYEYNEDYYSPATIANDLGVFFESNISCDQQACMFIEGTVTTIEKPNNLNYLYDDNLFITREISKLSSGTLNLGDHEYREDGYWYKSSDGPVDSLVFIHKLRTWNYLVTIVPIEDTERITNIISSYNIYVYATAIAIIFLWSFRLSNIIAKPIKNIEGVADEISKLNFDVEANEFNNKENKSLSRSINLISKNFKATLKTINKKNSELRKLYDKQSQQVQLKKQLVSSISHELKTPLMIMQVTIQGILDGIIKPDDLDDELKNVLYEISRSSMMIQDMLQIYRLDDANTSLDPVEYNLTSELNAIINNLKKPFIKYNFTIKKDIDENVYVEADRKLINRVISNYLTNAIKYTESKSTIEINLKKQLDNTVLFEVINHGTEILEDDLEKIWHPFYRSDHNVENSHKSTGSGIGLYLVSEVLKSHQANFGLENTKNGVKAYFIMTNKQ